MATRIGILGSGDAGQALGSGFARHGYDVMLGSRDPAKLADWKAEAKGKTGTFAEAAKHGEIVILATNGLGTLPAIDLAGVSSFDGKLVLDATNPLDFSKGMPPGLFVGTTDSLGEQVQRKLPRAHVVKCFNTVTNSQMVDPEYREGVPPMLICGNDAGAKKRTEEILLAIGHRSTLDVGGIDGARWLEALVPLWVRAGFAIGTWKHAFKAIQ